MPSFFQNEEFTYIKNKYVEENSCRSVITVW